jgi:hypothetical protein
MDGKAYHDGAAAALPLPAADRQRLWVPMGAALSATDRRRHPAAGAEAAAPPHNGAR